MSTITTSSSSKTAELDAPLHAIGFELDVLSPNEVTGTLKITETCCQPFGVLHGGISALIAEALGSIGAHLVAGPGVHRIAGIQLSIYHHSSAKLGDVVYARATPVRAGKTIQVWEVNLWKMNSVNKLEKGALIASSNVTCLANMHLPEEAKQAGETLRKYARL